MKKKLGAILLTLVLAVALAIPMAVSVGANPGPGIVGLWHLDGDVTDDSGNGNNGTEMNSPTYDNDQWGGQAIELDGSSQYVEVSDNATLDITDEITIEAWICPSTIGGYQYIVSKRGLDYYANYGFRLNGQKLEFYYNGPNAGVSPYDWNVWQTGSDVISTVDSWYHVAVSFVFGSGSVRCCVNGTSVSGSWLVGPSIVMGLMQPQRMTSR